MFSKGFTSKLALLTLCFLIGCSTSQEATQPTYTTKNLILTDTGIAQDSAILKLIAPYKTQLDMEMNAIIGYSCRAMDKGKPESILGNCVSDLVFDEMKKLNYQFDFCLLNTGGLRVSLPKGEISLRKAFELMPFENTLCIVSLNAVQMQELVNTICENGGDPVSGIQINLSTQKFTLADTPLGRHYKVLTTNYLVNGGDNYQVLGEATQVEETPLLLRNIIIEGIKSAHQQGSEICGSVDGRIL